MYDSVDAFECLSELVHGDIRNGNDLEIRLIFLVSCTKAVCLRATGGSD